MKVLLFSRNLPNIKLPQRDLVKHAHFTFIVDAISRACSHQLVRHRMASYSQQSQRYVSMKNFPYIKPPSIGSKTFTLKFNGEQAKLSFDRLMNLIGESYEELINLGVPKEDARFILPNACSTRIMFTMNGEELIHFLRLRTCNRAQWEIREMAIEMLRLLRGSMPDVFNAVGPNCYYLGYCTEGEKSCGKQKEVKEFFKKLGREE